jgi:hypothetical protein
LSFFDGLLAYIVICDEFQRNTSPNIALRDVSLNFTQNAVKKKEELVLLFRIGNKDRILLATNSLLTGRPN